MKYIKDFIPYVIIIAVIILVRSFIVTPVRVSGSSMFPTLKNNDIVLLKKFDKKIDRFDIIVFEYNDSKLIKRVIGLPGEHIKYVNGILYINNKKVDDVDLDAETYDFYLDDLGYEIIPENHYFVLGDNREVSQDSRTIGLISDERIAGVGVFRVFPLNKLGVVK